MEKAKLDEWEHRCEENCKIFWPLLYQNFWESLEVYPTLYILPAIPVPLESPAHPYPQDLSNCFPVCFSFPFHPILLTFSPSFISISIIFFGSISALVPLIMLIWGICYSRGPSASVLVSLSFTLSSYSISWWVSIFGLCPRFLPSGRKAINPAGPAAGSRQSLGSRSCGEGAAERRGHGKAGALLLHQGRGEAEKIREMSLPEGSHSFPAVSRHLALLSVVSQGTWVPPLYAPNRGFSSKNHRPQITHSTRDLSPPSFLGSPKMRELKDPGSLRMFATHPSLHEHWDNKRTVTTGCWEGTERREKLNWPRMNQKVGHSKLLTSSLASLKQDDSLNPWSLV